MACPTQGPQIRPYQLKIRPLGSGHDVVHVYGPPPASIRTLAPGFLEEDLRPQEAPGGAGVEGEVLGAAQIIGARAGPAATSTRDGAAMGEADTERGPGHDSDRSPAPTAEADPKIVGRPEPRMHPAAPPAPDPVHPA
jgi:hypothetical protein